MQAKKRYHRMGTHRVSDESDWRKLTQQRLLSRRQFMQASVLSLGSIALAACGRGGGSEGPDTPTPSPTTDAGSLVQEVAGYDDPTRWAGRTIVVTSWGGEYQSAQERAIIEPFQRLTGAQVETATTDLSVLRSQVLEGNPRWDVCDVLFEDVLPLANLGVVESLDYSSIRSLDILENARLDHGIGSSFYSTVLSYRTEAWPDQPPPSGWQDFWDIERYPGTRGLHRNPQTTLEFALLSDGVPLTELYPIDLDHAFARLTEIQPALALWWEQGAQPTQMISTGDLDLVGAWNSRIERIRQEGSAVNIVWNGGALSGDAWVIPRGSANIDVAHDFINFATRAEVAAAFSSLVPFGPVNRSAFDHLPDAIARRLPTYPANREQQFTVNFEWWYNHRESVTERFEQWFAEHP